MEAARRMTAADFEERYRREDDPWDYATSRYEHEKYAATLRACGNGPFTCALELGSSIGVFSRLLAPRCRSLVTIDGSPTAVAAARGRLAGCDGVTAVTGRIPSEIPRRRYDLVVASEVLYYLSAAELADTLTVIRECLVAGGRMVAVHWRPGGPERPYDAAIVHDRLRGLPWLQWEANASTDAYLLDVLGRR